MTNGSMGTNNADFEKAREYIKQYIMITNDTLSKTGLEKEFQNEIIRISKESYYEAEKILKEQNEKIQEIALRLLEKKKMKSDEVIQIFSK